MKRIIHKKAQKQKRKITGQRIPGPAGSVIRKMLKPLMTAIGKAISPTKEKSWFPALSLITQLVCGIFYHFFNLPSMRATVEKVNRSPSALGLGKVSLSTFSDAMKSRRRLTALWGVFNNLLLSFTEHLSPRLQKFRHIALLDSTIIHCVLSASWAQFRQQVNACKAHLVFDFTKGIPDTFILSAAKMHDRNFFEIFLKKGWTFIVDKAYIAYSLFDYMIENGVYVITRLKDNAVYEVIKEKRVKRKHRKLGVITDQIILLGEGAVKMVHEMRLIIFQAEDGKVYKFLTNRFDLAPISVAALFRARWAIELFFKFLKRTLRGNRLLSRSEIGAEMHVLIALMTDLLLKLMAIALGVWKKELRHVPAAFMRAIGDFFFRLFSARIEFEVASTIP